VRFHLPFTPTASWLNLIERWFALLSQKQIKRGALRSVGALESSLLPIELVTDPAIVARVFAATQAGFEALLAPLDSDPGQPPDATMQSIAPERMTDESVAGVADLFGEAFRRSQETAGWAQWSPLETAVSFVRDNKRRLSIAQRETFFGAIAATCIPLIPSCASRSRSRQSACSSR
jgi:hypothetical protein